MIFQQITYNVELCITLVCKRCEKIIPIVNHFINFILKRTEGGATVDFIITLLTSSTAENHNFTTGYSLGWRHLSLQNKFGIKKIKLVTIMEIN